MYSVTDFIISLFDVVLGIIWGGCQFIGSIILFLFLFIVFILMGYFLVILIAEIPKETNYFAKPKADDLQDYLDEIRKGETNDN